KRKYNSVMPLSVGRFTGKWTPKLDKNDILLDVSTSTGASTSAVMGFVNKRNGRDKTFLFLSDVAGNGFGPRFSVGNAVFDANDSPVMAYDGAANLAVLGASRGCPSCLGQIMTVDMATGVTGNTSNVGLGFVNGIAVDEADGIACTTTEIDFSVE